MTMKELPKIDDFKVSVPRFKEFSGFWEVERIVAASEVNDMNRPFVSLEFFVWFKDWGEWCLIQQPPCTVLNGVVICRFEDYRVYVKNDKLAASCFYAWERGIKEREEIVLAENLEEFRKLSELYYRDFHASDYDDFEDFPIKDV